MIIRVRAVNLFMVTTQQWVNGVVQIHSVRMARVMEVMEPFTVPLLFLSDIENFFATSITAKRYITLAI